AADRHQRVAALDQRLGYQVLQLAGLVAAVRETGIAVLALGPDLRAAELGGQPGHPVHRRRAEQQLDAVEVLDAHGQVLRLRSRCRTTSVSRPSAAVAVM